jgi:hypothetical protein
MPPKKSKKAPKTRPLPVSSSSGLSGPTDNQSQSSSAETSDQARTGDSGPQNGQGTSDDVRGVKT